MREIMYVGEFHMREHARKVETASRMAWMLEDSSPETQPRRRFRRPRGQ